MNLGFYENVKGLRGIYMFYPLLLAAGFILRVLLSPYWSFEADFATFKAWAYAISNVGFSEFYDKTWCDYMPGYLYILWLLRHIHNAFPQIPDAILFKLPANISDLGISILVFYVLRNVTSSRIAKIASLAYFFNPASLSNSTFWGQVDSVHALPILASILLGVRKHFVLSSLFVVIAFMIKPQSVVIFPIIGFFIVRELLMRKKEDGVVLKSCMLGLKIIAVSIITIVVITLPYIWGELTNNFIFGVLKETILFIKERFYTAYSQYKYTSLNAFNFWGIFAMWQSDQIKFLGITYQRWGTIIFGAFYLLIFELLFLFELIRGGYIRGEGFKPIKRLNTINLGMSSRHSSPGLKDDGELTIRTFHAITLILFALFLFVTRAHERHFLPTIVFFTIIAFRSWVYCVFYVLISLVYVVNMFYAYTKYYPIQGFSSSSINSYIPGVVVLLLIIFLIPLMDFIRNSIGLYRIKGT
jgi:Gpi18-like mannosyltransferase